MKTLTEFSGTLIRLAAKAIAEAKKSLPKDASKSRARKPEATEPIAPQPREEATTAALEGGAAPVEPKLGADETEAGASGGKTQLAAPGEGAAQPDSDAALSAPAAEETAGAADAAKVRSSDATEVADELVESDEVKAALDEAVAKATGASGDKLARLREALHAVGRQADRVRLVRVFSGEEPVTGAKKVGEHQYIVDLMPASMKQTFQSGKDERGGRRGPRRPSGPGAKAKGDTLEGSFSMESVMQDRRNERGPGRGRPGGGRGGRPGGRPGGARKP